MKGGEKLQVIPFIAFHQMQQKAILEESHKQSLELLEEQQSFQSLLNTNQQNLEAEETNKQIVMNENESQLSFLIPGTNVQMDEQLVQLVDHEQNTDIEMELPSLETDELANEEGEQQLTTAIINEQPLQSVDETVLLDETDGENQLDKNVIRNEVYINPMTEQDMIPVIDTIKTMLPTIGKEKNLKEIASRLLPIIEKWTLLKQQEGEGELKQVLRRQLTEEQLDIWKFIESNVDKRKYFANHYRQDAQITRADIANWLHAALDRYATTETKERVVTQSIGHSRIVPMSEVQQYTIHLQSLDRVERVSEELTQRIVNIIKESRFMTRPSLLQPMQQLTVVLKPEHLGNITVRLTQVDGNMTVNFIVTSQATKELLEANVHQLKHMFSPHQVTIERNESISDEDFFKNHEENERHEEESSSDQSNESNEEREDESELDFRSFIEQLTKGG